MLITHEKQSITDPSNDMLYGQRKNVRCMTKPMRELTAHPSALLVHKISEDIRIIGENTDGDERCILTGSGHYLIEPNGEARINLGVSVKPPIGTKVTVAPVNRDKEEVWNVMNHKVVTDNTGEIIAWVRNRSNAQIIIADKTQVAALHVSRIKTIDPARDKSEKVRKLVQKGNALTVEDTKDDTMMAKWIKQIQDKTPLKNHRDAI